MKGHIEQRQTGDFYDPARFTLKLILILKNIHCKRVVLNYMVVRKCLQNLVVMLYIYIV